MGEMLKSETNLDENLARVSSEVLEEEDTFPRNMTKFCLELCSSLWMENCIL